PSLSAVPCIVALVNEPPALMLERVADEPARLRELRLVRRVPRHGFGQAVRREEERRCVSALGGQTLQRVVGTRGRGLDEERMIERKAQPVDARRRRDALRGVVEILSILPAARIRAEGTRYVGDRVAYAVAA